MNPSSGGPPQGIRNVTEELLKKGIQTTVVSLEAPESSFLEGDSFQTIAFWHSKCLYIYYLSAFVKCIVR